MPESSTSLSEGGDAPSESETTTELEPGLIERLRALVDDDSPVSARTALPSFAGAGI